MYSSNHGNCFSSDLPLNVYVPSFGQWGFNLAVNNPAKFQPDSLQIPATLNWATNRIWEKMDERSDQNKFRFLNKEIVPGLFQFNESEKEIPLEINRLENQILSRYYESSWDQWR